MATLEDIARKVGVSKSTVSKALSGAGDVSEAMRRTVLDAAVELGYSRLRRSEELPKLAIFITNMAYRKKEDFGYDIIVGFRKMAEPDGFQVDIIPLTTEFERENRYDSYIMEHNYRGALFLGLSLDHPWLEEFKTCKTPTVLYDNQVSGNPMVTYVGADNDEGMHMAVSYLKQLGHTNIGYMGSALGAYIYRLRYHAFFDALRISGLPDEITRSGIHYSIDDCIRLHLKRILNMGCTAIMCSHDMIALKVMERCQELGYRIPEDISILGFDDVPQCRTSHPPLSTIRQNRTEIGKSCYCALTSQMQGVPLSTFLLHTALIERGSCAPSSK